MKLKLSLLSILVSLMSFAQTAPSYYSGIDFSQTQNSLKNALATLITNTHHNEITYDELKTLLASSDADPDVPGNILLVYGSQNSGIHQRSRNKNSEWNREHVYAKSKGTPNLGQSGPGSDGHHLRPADNNLNSNRGNLSFADGSGATAVKSNGGWYPGDEWKGDIARILMYMYVRYNTRCKPLNITQGPSTYSSDFPDILLKWNVEDPVSDFERQRNNITANLQGDRNPFIDNAYLATVIWGGPAAENSWPDTFSGGTSSDTEAPTIPTNLTVTGTSENSVSLSWNASTDNVAVASYQLYVNNVYNNSVTATSATISGLSASTNYTFYVVAKDTAGNLSEFSNTVNATTDEAPENGTTCGTEDFSNTSSISGVPDSSYTDRTWSNNGITWNATKTRIDTQIYQEDNNKAICIRKGSLISSTISGGIGSFSVRTKLPFNDSEGNYVLKINGVEVGQIPYAKTAKTYTIEDINISGNVVIELVDATTNNRVSFDNLSWTCYDGATMNATETATSAKKLTIYPNPVKNQKFFIKGLKDGETIQIYNLNGQLVQTNKHVTNNGKIQLKNVPKGVYIIKARNQSTKLIVD